MRVAGGRCVLRRSRGLRARTALPLPVAAAAPLLACGAELKSTFCLAKGGRAWVGHHIGDLDELRDARVVPRRASPTSSGCSRCAPAVVAHDLHPDYLSTALRARARGRRARRRPAPPRPPRGVPRRARRAPARRSGAIFDGTGLGDATARSGAASCSSATCAGFERAGHLLAGAAAGRRPRRRASRGGWRARGCRRRRARRADARGRWRRRPARAGDAVAALARSGLRGAGRPRASGGCSTPSPRSAACAPRCTYEGQAAIELEAACDPAERGAYPLPVDRARRALVLDARAAIAAVGRRRPRRASRPARIAARFHHGARRRHRAPPAPVAAERRLGHGRALRRRVPEPAAARAHAAAARGGRAARARPARLPPNDGGIAFGQAAVAAARTAED